MSAAKGIVLDANILIRAALGKRVRNIIMKYEESVRFYAPDSCLRDAEKYAANISKHRALDPELGLAVLKQLGALVEQVDHNLYNDHEPAARSRIDLRDPDDWPVVAVALLLNLPIWTEDQDFFGSGIATWTTDRVELYLA